MAKYVAVAFPTEEEHGEYFSRKFHFKWVAELYGKVFWLFKEDFVTVKAVK